MIGHVLSRIVYLFVFFFIGLREEGSHDHLTVYENQHRFSMANPLGFSIIIIVVIIIEMQD